MSERLWRNRNRTPLVGIVFPFVVVALLAACVTSVETPTPSSGGASPGTPSPAVERPSPTPASERIEVSLASASLRDTADGKTELIVQATLPDACTEARHRVGAEGDRIIVEIWGERPVGVACAQVLREVDLTIPLGRAVTDDQTVEVNGMLVARGPLGSGSHEYGAAFVEQVTVHVGNGEPRHVTIEVQGSLPDACSELVENPSVTVRGHEVIVQLQWQRPRDLVCAQVLRPFTTTVDVGNLDPGAYTLSVNDFTTTFTVEGS
ncbi:hypothetical protein OO015_07705 [Thermomicrobium sp. 4228-Ro]|uniref:hypothetical protein n=1 Tax=Thermomicrobium sp. 4228-Ro TaxID=2993937 RepID=UPI00224914BA|nr:hypothetical protein [Thermomicrobium sp. 4228-Ro]MCX2727382.1 hypothetical protein [Thermomicrobium sp. 4228-Ro]